MFLTLRESALTEEFDYNFIKYALREYKHPRVKINDLLKKGEIIRVKKGLYIFGEKLAGEPYSKETLANLIYGPSYISLEYALSFYGLFPEHVETVTSVTNKRKKFFHTPVGDFSYTYITPSIYPWGITLYNIDKYHSILIATKEKALDDIFYLSDDTIGEDEIETYLFEDMRLDMEDFRKFNLRKLKKLSQVYGDKVKSLYKFLEKVK